MQLKESHKEILKNVLLAELALIGIVTIIWQLQGNTAFHLQTSSSHIDASLPSLSSTLPPPPAATVPWAHATQAQLHMEQFHTPAPSVTHRSAPTSAPVRGVPLPYRSAPPRGSPPSSPAPTAAPAPPRPSPPPPPGPQQPPCPPFPPQLPSGALAATREWHVLLVGDSTDRMLLANLCRLCTAVPQRPDDAQELQPTRVKKFLNSEPYICDSPGGCVREALGSAAVENAFGCRCDGGSRGPTSAAFVQTFGVARPYLAAWRTHQLPGLGNTTEARAEAALQGFFSRLVCGRARTCAVPEPYSYLCAAPPPATPPQRVLVVLQSNFWDVGRVRTLPALQRWMASHARDWAPDWQHNFTALLTSVQAWARREAATCHAQVCVAVRTAHRSPNFWPESDQLNAALHLAAAPLGVRVFDWAAAVARYQAQLDSHWLAVGREDEQVLSDGIHQRKWVSQRLLEDLAAWASAACTFE